MKQTTITISRQFGSGGREVGEKLAKNLGINFYDKELLKRASKDSGISENLFENADEAPVNSLLYSLMLGSNGTNIATENYLTNDKLFAIQAQTIRKLADEESCVIIGRCSDYILREHQNCINVFIHAPINIRIKRIMDVYQLNEKDAKNLILKTDKKRANYYNFFTDQNWGDIQNYHIVLDTSFFGIENTFDLLTDIIRNKN